LKVIQAVGSYPPIRWGGTEVYLTGLVRALRAHDVQSTILTPADATSDYDFEGASVRIYPDSPLGVGSGQRELGLGAFTRLLDEERPRIYHQHSWTPGLGGAHLSAARASGIPTVVTVHTPGYHCLRGTMIRFGKTACDGRIVPPVCASCASHAAGAPLIAALAMGMLPRSVSAELVRRLPRSRATTALGMRAGAERWRTDFRQMADDADRIVVVCQWLLDALALNGAPKHKLHLSRAGIDPELAVQLQAVGKSAGHDGQYRILYLGRLEAKKGVHVLVEAVASLPKDPPVHLALHTVGEDGDYALKIRRLAAADARISIRPPLARDQVASALVQADVLAVPSLCLETGPLVVLEAKAATLPIIGSRLGGIAELVAEPDDGVLVAPGDIPAWRKAIVEMAASNRRRKPVVAPVRMRTMADAAGDMVEIYAALAG
jgi:glycosyltransferase involved in cell wall biosynthesis